MFTKKIYELGNLTLIYAEVDGRMSFCVVPTELKEKLTDSKFTLDYIKKNGFTHVFNTHMVQVSLVGDVTEKEFYCGESMQCSSTGESLKFYSQTKNNCDGYTEIVTEFKNQSGLTFINHVTKDDKTDVLVCYNTLKNDGEKVVIEMINSFSIAGISPFCDENDIDNIVIHSFKNKWSNEGRLNSKTAAELQLEDSWSSYGLCKERISQRGSMPCRHNQPFYAVEDKREECVWAVSMEAPISWQMDVTHRHGAISVCGGIADFENGHWRKELKKGESFSTNKAYITAIKGNLEVACAALQRQYMRSFEVSPADENLPILYNEYCCSWGNPSMANLKPMIDYCADIGVKHFVMDVGWWRQDERSWYTLGDWNPGEYLFPNGISELSNYIASKGMTPGIWFEFESASVDSLLFENHKDWFLTRDGKILQHRERVLPDVRKKEVHDYLYEKVIKLVKDNNFKYVKLDYNEPMGIGCDGEISYGEGLRQHNNAVYDFIKQLKAEVPGLVVELCSSGGLRNEPKFLAICDMASFSDAHLGIEGAIIAMDLHRCMLPRQMQIWATVQSDYSLNRVYFTLIKGMLGRLCLSGDIINLTEEKRQTVLDSVDFYNDIKHIIKEGDTLVINKNNLTKMRFPEGREYLIRFNYDKTEALLFFFAFGKQSYAVTESVLAEFEVDKFFVYGDVKKIGDTVEFTATDDSEGIFAGVVYLKK